MRYLHRNIVTVLFFILNLIAVLSYGQVESYRDSVPELMPPFQGVFQDSVSVGVRTENPEHKYTIFDSDTMSVELVDSITLRHRADSLVSLPISRTDSLLYAANPLALPLVYMGKDINQIWTGEARTDDWLYPPQKSLIYVDTTKNMSSEMLVAELRTDARRYVANNHIDLYVTTLDRLPHLSTFMSRPILGKKIEKISVYDEEIDLGTTKIDYEKIRQVYWQRKANAMLQFTQNYVSSNWHQGGRSNLAFLSIFLAEFNYDNRKNIQWDNKFEWRAGFHSVDGDTLRKISTNDDLVRYLTKFGIKAGGNWYYSISGEVSTHLFDNYRKINSNELKIRLFTPVRANLGIGMDYKYKKIFSLMLAPVTFKYIYVNDTVNVNPNSFGVKKGENQLKQLGSSMLAQLNYSPMLNWNISSRFRIYTDYEKVEADWEIVNSFIINRFLSARLLVNPRYDNTVIVKKGEKKATIQLKELLSVGFSYRFF